MKGELYQYDLDFIEECKRVFENDHRRFTHINKDGDRIALRYGADHDCIKLFELGSEKAFFHNIMKKCPVKTVKVEEDVPDNMYLAKKLLLEYKEELEIDLYEIKRKILGDRSLDTRLELKMVEDELVQVNMELRLLNERKV